MAEMTTARYPMQPCLNCDYQMDAATPAENDEESEPKEGSVALCMRCGYAMIYGQPPELRFRRPTAEERKDIDQDPVIRRARAVLFLQRKGMLK